MHIQLTFRDVEIISGQNVTVSVQVNPAAWQPGNVLLSAKCLGVPGMLRCGIVTGAGIVRDGIQRNIEVAYFVSSGDEKQDSSGYVVRSLYPAFALCTASSFSVFTEADYTSLIATLQRIAQPCGSRSQPIFDAETIVLHYRADAWSQVWRLPELSSGLGEKKLLEEFLEWQLSRKSNDLLKTQLRMLLAKSLQPDTKNFLLYCHWDCAAEAEAQMRISLLSHFSKLPVVVFDCMAEKEWAHSFDSSCAQIRNLNPFYCDALSRSYTIPWSVDASKCLQLPDINGWLNWTDATNDSVAHHVARSRLLCTLQAIYSVGGSMWSSNKDMETPAALALGLYGPRPSVLHRACYLGELLDIRLAIDGLDKSAAQERLLVMAASTPADYLPEFRLLDVRNLMLKGLYWEALVQARRSLADGCLHARAYLAAAMLEEGFGPKAVLRELDNYFAQLASCISDDIVDPIVYYVHYRMWQISGYPKIGKMQHSARHALEALKCFPGYAADFVDEQDNVDHGQRHSDEISSQIGDNLADCESEHEVRMKSDTEIEWQEAKNQYMIQSAALDRLMGLTGIGTVKKLAIQIVKDVLLARSRPGGVLTSPSLFIIFLGNPGCGKTMVSQLFSRALIEIGLKTQKAITTLSAPRILREKPDPVSSFEIKLQSAAGGTIIIDDAHHFSPRKVGEGQSSPSPSNEILDIIKEAIDDNKAHKNTTFILIGHREEMGNILGYSSGFASCFTHQISFDDFDESQLRRIMIQMIQERGLRFESQKECGTPLAQIITQRIVRYRNTKGFGNARTVRQKVDEMVSRQTHRLGTLLLKNSSLSEIDHRTITRDDALGSRPDSVQVLDVLREVDSLVGLNSVKEALHKLVDLQKSNYDRELAGERPELISLHRVFYGNPGTGKTTVARIYGALLKELGLLTNGAFLQCTPADLTGDAEGGAASNTKTILERARGKVLFIDEAYILDPNRKGNQYGGNVLDTLVEKLEGEAGSDIAVILAGYTNEMFSMLENNPGLRRRFNIDDFGLHFEDLSDNDIRKASASLV